MHATLNGTEIYFDVDGAELAISKGSLVTRPTIIALHGGPGFDHGYLLPGLGPLRENAQVVYVDLRGQGRSGRPPLETCTLEQMADDIAALAAHLGIERPVIFGHSAGGFVALHLALRHPALVRALVLCSTTPKFGPQSDGGPPPKSTLASRAPADVAAVANRFFGGDMSEETVRAFGEKVNPYYAGPTHMDVPRRLHALTTITMDVMQHFFSKLARQYDVRSKLGSISAPTLIVGGEHDWVVSPAAHRILASEIPNSEIVWLEESGHYGFSEEPEKFLSSVRGFLTKLS
jgi:proline iminopeptidase